LRKASAAIAHAEACDRAELFWEKGDRSIFGRGDRQGIGHGLRNAIAFFMPAIALFRLGM
jgi:hypothetical protein